MSERIFLIRVDGGRREGLGHIARCVSLAYALEKKGFLIALLSRDRPELCNILKPQRLTSIAMPSDIDEDQAARFTVDIFLTLGGDALLVDLPDDLDLATYRSYESLGIPIVLLDDHGPGKDLATLTVNAIAHPDHLEDALEGERILNGPDYIILDPAFNKTKTADFRDSGKRVIIAMGGSDPFGITAKALRALIEPAGNFELHVLLGPAHVGAGKLKSITSKAKSKVIIHEKVDNLPEFLKGFDLGILSFGLTTYGAAYLGLPTVVLGHNDAGSAAGETFAKKYGCSVFVGRHDRADYGDLAKIVQSLLDDHGERRAMSERGRKAVDGRGLQRIVKHLIEIVK